MKDSVKLFWLDFITIKNYIKQMILACVFVSIVITPSLPFALNVVYFVLASTFLMYPFMVSEANGLDKLISFIPTNKKAIVNAKYLTAVFYILITAVVLIPVNFLIYQFQGGESAKEMTLLYMLIGIVMYVLVVSIQLPCCFRYGYSKAKILSMILPIGIGFGVPTLVFVLKTFLDETTLDLIFIEGIEAILSNLSVLFIGIIVFSILLFSISYRISLRIYSKK